MLKLFGLKHKYSMKVLLLIVVSAIAGLVWQKTQTAKNLVIAEDFLRQQSALTALTGRIERIELINKLDLYYNGMGQTFFRVSVSGVTAAVSVRVWMRRADDCDGYDIKASIIRQTPSKFDMHNPCYRSESDHGRY